jgi:nicotinate-nucleotide adenylyltransferase
LPVPEHPTRIGIFGGTFDPPHAGHVAAARAVMAQLGLDRLLLVVANDPWQKAPRRRVSPAEDRLALARAAADGVPGIEVSRTEIDRGGPSYTVETVEALRREAEEAGRPAPDIFLIVGADLVESLPTWERVDDLRRLVTLVIVSRPRSPRRPDPDGWRVAHVEGVEVDVSSSDVRALLSAGRSVDRLVPEAVIRCIRRRDMYAVGR